MALTREKKQAIEEKIASAISDSDTVVFVNFHGLSTPDANELRETLAASEVRYMVAKKTLLRRALLSRGVQGDEPSLDGEVALVFGKDAVLPAKGIADFRKKHKESLRILGGIIENRFADATRMAELAKVPSREVLYGQLVGVMYAPVRGIAQVLGGTIGSLAIVLDQIAKKK